MYDSGPSDEELNAIGVRREDVTDKSTFEVWPENWTPFEVFAEMGTQWRIGANGPTGLDYNVAFRLMDLQGFKNKKQLEVVRALRIMESAAIKQMSVK